MHSSAQDLTTPTLFCLAYHQKTPAVFNVHRTLPHGSSSGASGGDQKTLLAYLNSYTIHWLPVEWRIKFKIACITHKTISTTQPAYLYSSLKRYTPSRTLRSSDSKLLFVPRVRTCFGSRSFAVAAPTIWNSLPLAIRSSVSTDSFRRQLKTFFYNLAFRPS